MALVHRGRKEHKRENGRNSTELKKKIEQHFNINKKRLFTYLFRFYENRVSLCSPGCLGTHSVDQAGLELRDPPASASQVLGLKACATTPGYGYYNSEAYRIIVAKGSFYVDTFKDIS